MARRVTDGEGQPAHSSHVTVGEGRVGGRHGGGGYSERLRLLGDVVVQRAVGGVQIHGRPRGGGYARHAQDVIEVGMREPHGDRARPSCAHLFENEAGLLPWIDDGALARGLVDHEVAVLEERAVGDGNDLHEAAAAFVFACSRSRRAATYFSTAIAAVVASPTAV